MSEPVGVDVANFFTESNLETIQEGIRERGIQIWNVDVGPQSPDVLWEAMKDVWSIRNIENWSMSRK